MRLLRDRRLLIAAIAALTVALIGMRAGAAAASASPKAALSIDPAPGALTVRFVAQSGNFPAPVVSYHWSFGDGRSAATGKDTVIHTYPSASTFSPSVTETDSSQDKATATATLTLSRCPAGSAQCTQALSNAGKVHLLQVTGPVSSSAPPAQVDLLAGTFRFGHCYSAIQTAVAATDSGFTGSLSVTLKYFQGNVNNVKTTCFSSTVSFADAAGAFVHTGALPPCQPAAPSPPCVQSILVSGHQVTKQLLIPPGDPKVGAP